MDDRTLIRTGGAGATVAAVRYATPVRVTLLSALGLLAWVAGVDLILILALLIGLAMVATGILRRRRTRDCCAGAGAGDGAPRNGVRP